MKDGMAALDQNNKTGLNDVCSMKDLFRRVAYDNIRFEFNLLLFGEFANRDETALKSLTPVIEDRMELRALGWFGRPNHRQDK